ncbi:hypothetical protein BC567DRAFT_258969 [Phyllosticta citribraziliensis]
MGHASLLYLLRVLDKSALLLFSNLDLCELWPSLAPTCSPLSSSFSPDSMANYVEKRDNPPMEGIRQSKRMKFTEEGHFMFITMQRNGKP